VTGSADKPAGISCTVLVHWAHVLARAIAAIAAIATITTKVI